MGGYFRHKMIKDSLKTDFKVGGAKDPKSKMLDGKQLPLVPSNVQWELQKGPKEGLYTDPITAWQPSGAATQMPPTSKLERIFQHWR
jgi:hypothetical protein